MNKYNEEISYEILENGYRIYLNGNPWIAQLDEYSKPMDKNKSFEENCLMQLEEITKPTTNENPIAGEYDSEKLYAENDYCVYNNELFKCNVQCQNQLPTDGNFWVKCTLTEELNNLINQINS